MAPVCIVLALASAWLAGSARADGVVPDVPAVVTAGNAHGAVACQACHGRQGLGTSAANFPRLAGLGSAYLVRQLVNFQTGARQNPVMAPIAHGLDASEIDTVSRYYAALPGPTLAVAPLPEGAERTRGETLAVHGDWPHGVPACSNCHGPGGVGISPDFPSLLGQSAPYLAAQLVAWRDGARTGSPLGLMEAVARKLDAADIAPVAAYFASLPTATAPGVSP